MDRCDTGQFVVLGGETESKEEQGAGQSESSDQKEAGRGKSYQTAATQDEKQNQDQVFVDR